MGTAQYLSPEQAQGYAVTAAADLYSVGVILYELLTGVVPFEGETAVAIAFKQVAATPRAPSELNPAIPPTLDAIVLRALAKDPAARYADADELIAALEHERAALPAYSFAHPPVGGYAPATAVAPPPPLGMLMTPAEGYGEEPAGGPRDARRRTLAWVLAGLLVAGLVALALLLLLPGSANVTVPNVTGQSEQAASVAIGRAGLTSVPSLAPSSTVPIGRVISQSPVAGSSVHKGSRVSIVVSDGPASKALPTVEGLTAQQATSQLQAAGFKPVTKSEASTKVAVGRVIGTSPSAGTDAQVGSMVSVIVSSGPAAVRVPNVVGQSRSAAEATLENAGLALGTVGQRVSSAQTPGTVLAQSPAAGSSLHAGGQVSLTVAQVSNEVAVPDVVGKSEALAAAALGAVGLTPKTAPATTTEQSQVGIVLEQSPASGAHVRKGAVVTIGVGTLGTPTTTTPTTTTTTPTTTMPTAGPTG